jgi:DNA (cytosine-5)-methyltransferase 1
MMRVGSLFTGIGGFDLAFDRAGFKVAWQVEIDRFCNRVLEVRWPMGVKRYGDIREVDPAALEPVDAIVGGFPCQDLSIAGRRAGLGGERSGLWWEFHRILAGIRPRWCVVENVPGLLSSNGGRDMGAILRALGDLGYGWAYRVLDAQWFGLAQRRKRVFIVGCLGDGAAAAEVLLEPESSMWNPSPRREAGKDIAGTLGGGSGRRGWCNDLDRSGAFVPVVRCLTADGRRMDGETETFVIQDRCPGGDVRLHGDVSPTATRRWGTGGQQVPYVAHTLRAEGHDASEDGTGRGTPLVWEARYIRNGRGAPSTIAPTLKAESGKGDGAPLVGVRRITPREAERLQGFPDGWTCLCEAEGDTTACRCPDSPRYRALGNAVAVPVAEWIAARIAAAMRVEVAGR